MSGTEPWGADYVIAGKFRLIRQLGRGGMGSVWAADHLALNSHVAVKIIDPAIASSTEALQRFLREAQAAAALRSPHVVQTFDYGVENGVPFIAMELLEGQTLAQRLGEVGKLSLETTAHILTQVGRAIARAHDAGIIHRDLKPDNIFLVRNDDEEIAKVLDFGIAKATGSALGTSSQTRTGAILGTPYYMSPEQAEGNRSVDHRTDLWSLAVIAFECATGKRPFESEALGDLILQICVRPIRKPSSVVATLPPSFDEWFAKATQRDPAQRFQSARELATGLRMVAGLRASGGESKPLPVGGTEADAPPKLAQTPERPLHVTTGGMGAVAHTSTGSSYGVPSRTSTPLIVGATIGALTLAAVVGLLVVRASGRAEPAAGASSGTAAAATSVAATAPKAEPLVKPPEPAVPASVDPLVAPAPTPAEAAASPSPVPDAPRSASPKPLAAPAKNAKVTPPVKRTEKPAEPAPPKKRVDFGF
jgi:serine/threonine protein kinase